MKPEYVFLFSLFVYHLCADVSVTGENGDQDWWKHAVFYQIYPKSFKDDNNDGMGDLRGIISKFSHLRDAGVTAVWLSPIYSSPQVDAGYDISNYVDVYEKFGTLDDFDDLIRTANEMHIKIVMDFVPNHSSDQHEWFKKSEEGDEEFKDYYVWRDGKNGGPPNNWLSVFKYSAWTWSEKRRQYYLHQFTPEQPDLNFDNPKVVQEFLDILKFWLDRGVYGFRIDAVKHLFETGFEDEPLSHAPNVQDFEYDYLDHIYTTDQPQTFEMVYEWRRFVDNYTSTHGGDARIIMTEVYSDIVTTMKYYGDKNNVGAHFSFNFFLITDLVATSSTRDIVMSVKRWMTYMPHEYVPNWVVSIFFPERLQALIIMNSWAITITIALQQGWAKENVDAFNMLLALLPGVAVTYNGEEIGMEDGEVTWDQGQDPSACNGSPEDFDRVSRDFERTPFHWDDSINAGFNEGHETWLPVSSKYVDNNLAQQSQEGVWSHYRVYQALLQLRKEANAVMNGRLEIEPYSNNVIVLKRSLKDQDAYILVFNIGYRSETVDLTRMFDVASEELQVRIPGSNSPKKIGDMLKPNEIYVVAYEAIVLVDSGSATAGVSVFLIFHCIFLSL